LVTRGEQVTERSTKLLEVFPSQILVVKTSVEASDAAGAVIDRRDDHDVAPVP
jgi:hypothetical protein